MNDMKTIQTPHYVFSKSKIQKSYKKMCKLMPGVKVFYSLKANGEKEIIKILHEIGAGFEVASEGEFKRTMEVGVSPDDIICGLPVKKEGMIRSLYLCGCRYFIFDMLDEYCKICRLASESKKILRLNINDLIPESLEFGMEYQELSSYIEHGDININVIDGISFHISNNIDIGKFNLVIERLEEVLNKLKLQKNKEFLVNIGGGYRLTADTAFYENLFSKVQRLQNMYNLRMIAEPGNAIVNAGGSLVTQVVAVREREGFQDVYMDAGKPSGLKTDNKRIPTSIKVISGKQTQEIKRYRFVDITCMHRPHFEFELAVDIQPGDYIKFGGMGAYSICLQSMFHVWDKPAIIIQE